MDVTANHKGFFTFRLCANNNTDQDPRQQCFDQTILKVIDISAYVKVKVKEIVKGCRLKKKLSFLADLSAKGGRGKTLSTKKSKFYLGLSGHIR